MRIVRRMCIGFSAGLFRRFLLKLNSFPHRLWVLADDACTEEDRRAAAEAFYALPPCCIGFFGQQLRRLFPNANSLLSTGGRTAIATWLRTLIWSIYNCEKEHASCRRLLLGTGPARSWTLAARERLLECSRTIHMERATWDPASDIRPGLAGPPAQQLAGAAMAGAPATAVAAIQNPLHADPCRSADGVGIPLQQVHAASDLSAILIAPPASRAAPIPSGANSRSGSSVAGTTEVLRFGLLQVEQSLAEALKFVQRGSVPTRPSTITPTPESGWRPKTPVIYLGRCTHLGLSDN